MGILSKKIIGSVSVCLALVTLPVQAADQKLTKTQQALENKIYLPLQSVVDLSLDKLGPPLFLPNAKKISSTDVYTLSLNLGMVTTDAIVALKNKDKALFEKYAGLTYDYAKRLNLSKNLLSSYATMQEPLAKGQFDQLEALMNTMRTQMADEMNQSYRKDQARLAYIAGWLEALYIASKSLEKKYSPQRAQVLQQRAPIVGQLIGHLQALHPRLHKRKDVLALGHALPQLKKILELKSHSPKEIRQLGQICASVHTVIAP